MEFEHMARNRLNPPSTKLAATQDQVGLRGAGSRPSETTRDGRLLTPPERDGCIDEGADARRGLGCAERDGELHLLSKVRERPEYDLREAYSPHEFKPQHHAVAGAGHAERRYEIADIMDDLDRESSSRRQPLQV